jgi:hypothetical protein
MGLLDVPARWDPSPWKNSNPPDAIDYERPREGFYMSTTPLDLHSADISSFMPTSTIETSWEKAEREKREKEEAEESKKQEQEEVSSKEEQPTDKLITSFQSFFGKSHPIIGKLYSGPKDGKMNPDLQTAAKAAEDKIASAIGDSGVKGMIWSGSGFATSPADVMGAINAIAKHNGKKSSFLTREERIEAFSSIIYHK